MNIDDWSELSDVEKWEEVINNTKDYELVDDYDEIYFKSQDPDTLDNIDFIFNESIEPSEAINSLLQALGFESHNY